MSTYQSLVHTDGTLSLSISNSSVQLTLPSVFSTTKSGGRATVQVRTAPIIITVNGVTPTAANEATGTKINVGDSIQLFEHEMATAKFIRATGADGAIFVSYDLRVD